MKVSEIKRLLELGEEMIEISDIKLIIKAVEDIIDENKVYYADNAELLRIEDKPLEEKIIKK